MKKIITLIMVAVLMISFAVVANAAIGTVVYATKVDEAPNMEQDTAFIDETWGEPAIVLNGSSENTELYKYWQENNQYKDASDWHDFQAILSMIDPDDGDVELYYLWDSKYLYFGIKAPDNSPSGAVQPWRGDGFQTWISPLAAIKQSYIQSQDMDSPLDEYYEANESLYDFYVTLDSSDWDSISGGAAASCDCDVYIEGDYMYGFVKIPLVSIGLNPKGNLHGVELATALIRISSTGVDDQGYAGWLSWGRYFYDTKLPSLNTIVLVDPAQGSVTVDTTPVETTAPETTAPETEAPETEAPETEAPETEAPETEAPVVETEAPVVETEAPVVETEAPETEAPVVETEAPETEAPVVETEAPETEAPVVETEAPETEAPVVETEAPETEAPVVETEAPETEAPVAPETNAPETQAPATPAEPVAKNNTGLIIGIVAAVVVIGAVVGIVLGKKKK